MKNKTKVKSKNKKVVKVAVDQTKPSESESTLRHTDLQTNTHTPAHAPTNTPPLLTTADTASVTTGVSHEASVADLGRRSHRRLVGPLPCESLRAGQTSSACRDRSDRDIPPNAELEDREILPHSRNLEDGVNSPYEQPWQRDLRLCQRDDWCSEDDEQASVCSAARNENREPRYYRDCDIPCSLTEVIPAQSVPRPVPRLRHATTSTSRYGIRNEVRPLNSIIDASQRGAEIRTGSTNDEQCNRRDVVTPIFSTIGASDVGPDDFQCQQPQYSAEMNGPHGIFDEESDDEYRSRRSPAPSTSDNRHRAPQSTSMPVGAADGPVSDLERHGDSNSVSLRAMEHQNEQLRQLVAQHQRNVRDQAVQLEV